MNERLAQAAWPPEFEGAVLFARMAVIIDFGAARGHLLLQSGNCSACSLIQLPADKIVFTTLATCKQ